jgi:hypothetical protein
MLKATELKLAKSEARAEKIGVVVYNDLTAEKKFRTMFGRRDVTVEQKGLAHYVSYGLHPFVARAGATSPLCGEPGRLIAVR